MERPHFNKIVDVAVNFGGSSRPARKEPNVSRVAYNAIQQKVELIKQDTARLLQERHFKVQSLHFDISSSGPSDARVMLDPREERSKHALKDSDTVKVAGRAVPLSHFLGLSSPELQTASLIQDLEAFLVEGGLNGQAKEQIDKVLGKVKRSERLSLLIGLVRKTRSMDEAKKLFKHISRELNGQIGRLKAGDSVLFPLAYRMGHGQDFAGDVRGRVGGHAISLDIRKNTDGTLQIALFNTGEGVGNHDYTRGVVRPEAKPLVYQKIDAKALSDDFFENLFPFVVREYQAGQDPMPELYGFLRGSLGRPEKTNHDRIRYKTQQQSLNCTKKALQVWLNDQLKDNRTVYKQFRAFRLQKMLKEVKESVEGKQSIKYKHSIGTWGGNKRRATGVLDFVLNLIAWFAGIFTGRARISTTIEKRHFDQMLAQGREIHEKRASRLRQQPKLS